MTNEKAFEHFTDRLSVIKSREGFGTEYIEATEIAIQAIEKQIPKKPYGTGSEPTGWEAISGYCPACDTRQSLGSRAWHKGFNKFCQECGQKLDWTEETE